MPSIKGVHLCRQYCTYTFAAAMRFPPEYVGAIAKILRNQIQKERKKPQAGDASNAREEKYARTIRRRASGGLAVGRGTRGSDWGCTRDG